jgi:hypothetical protein
MSYLVMKGTVPRLINVSGLSEGNVYWALFFADSTVCMTVSLFATAFSNATAAARLSGCDLPTEWSPSQPRNEVTSYLDERLPDQWIGRGGPVELPPRHQRMFSSCGLLRSMSVSVRCRRH